MHGYHLARKLGIRRMVVPPEAGVASASCTLAAPPRVDRVATLGRRLSELSAMALEEAFAGLEAEAGAVLAPGGWDDEALEVKRLADARCVGQGAHMPVRLPPAPWPGGRRGGAGAGGGGVPAAYLARYSREPPSVPIELVHARAVVRGRRAAGLATAAAPGQEGVARRQREVGFGAARMAASSTPATFLTQALRHRVRRSSKRTAPPPWSARTDGSPCCTTATSWWRSDDDRARPRHPRARLDPPHLRGGRGGEGHRAHLLLDAFQRGERLRLRVESPKGARSPRTRVPSRASSKRCPPPCARSARPSRRGGCGRATST